jgi:hypothetical protein
VDDSAAAAWLGMAARSSGCALVEVACAVIGGAPLPSDRLAQVKVQRREATDCEIAVHHLDSESHETAAG